MPFSEENLRAALCIDNKLIFKWKLIYNRYYQDVHFPYIRDYLGDMDCNIMLIERKYVDRDFLTDFSNYYVRCSTDYDRFCKRIHFFEKIMFDEEDIKLLLCNKKGQITKEELQENYLGFMVIKPLPDAIFGRTALKTYPPDNNRRHYCCIRGYKANLYGLKLNVDSLAFQEQDTVAAACATSALWSAFHMTSEIFDQCLSPTPIEITKFATKYWFGSRPIPSGGLNIMQMSQAIHEVGLEPHVRNIKFASNTSPLPLISFIYSYLKMKIPVILNVNVVGVGLHSITVTGYSLLNNRCNETETVPEAEFYLPLKGLRINEFYAHDDRIGPFCRIRIIPADNTDEEKPPLPLRFHIPSTSEILEPHSIVVPLYHKIRVVFLRIYEWIWYLHQLIQAGRMLPKNVEWDIYLSTLNQFKHDLINDNKYSNMRPKLLLMRLPRFIWRAKLYYRKKILLEIIADATDMDRSFFFKGIIFFNDNLKYQINNLTTNRRNIIEKVITEPFTKFLIEQSG